MKIAILTSSRADYGIYLPLLKELKKDPFFDMQIIAFGTHLSAKHGNTVNEITESGYPVAHRVDTIPDGDSPAAIAAAMGKTMINFARVWEENTYDLVIALGDRYEMFAACASAVPFGVPIAHIHGGETTLGAIDDTFRDSITQMATYHFTTTDQYRNRVLALKGSGNGVYKVGALSVDNLKTLPLLSIEAFKEKFNIDLNKPSILITFHPETVAFEKNERYIVELIAALREIETYQLIITMPNADTMGNMIRKHLSDFIASSKNAIGIESFGALGYLSCMKHSTMMLGNTSSGFVEAAFFSKYVINLGNRQSGRILSPNICNCEIKKDSILRSVADFANRELPEKIEIYGNGTSAIQICTILKNIVRD
ncbi:MAG: UDP-N-acetylglucosamine 2-epimerase [Sediminibacterium sp.]